ncbi:LysR family transcriptional regulator [Novosphingobium terrae]|uniref:LysR family transcriptional regulator n=1 Tax=Novosphingobium terrae TaxID=2726189 RepID=UPI0019813F32|nr:LysR family transcriptional regulator [Novosphingobium terrae]
MDYLAAMRLFVRVVERGSLSAAARDLGLGQPAVSERIARLEADLGARLLWRNTRALSVTDAGAAFYERCQIAIEAADDALCVVREEQALRGMLRIAAPHGLGELLLPPLLLRLREEHPGLKVDVVLNDRLVDPVTEGVDLSLRLGDVGDGRFAARGLGRVRRVLVASPAYLARHGTPETPEDLIRHGFARVSGLFNTDRLTLSTPESTTATAFIDIVASFSHWRPLHALLIGGGAIGVLQEPACRADLAAGRLCRLLPDFTVPGFDLHALFAARRPMPTRLRIVLALLQEEAGKLLA